MLPLSRASPLGSRQTLHENHLREFLNSSDFRGVTWHLCSSIWSVMQVKTVNTSQIIPKKVHTLPLGTSLLPVTSPFMACGGCSGNKQHSSGSSSPNRSIRKGGQELIRCFLALPVLGNSGRFSKTLCL